MSYKFYKISNFNPAWNSVSEVSNSLLKGYPIVVNGYHLLFYTDERSYVEYLLHYDTGCTGKVVFIKADYNSCYKDIGIFTKIKDTYYVMLDQVNAYI